MWLKARDNMKQFDVEFPLVDIEYLVWIKEKLYIENFQQGIVEFMGKCRLEKK